jgi:hypothetical protein
LLADGTVLVAGGFGTGPENAVERYDPTGNTWSAVRPLGEARVGHTATRLPDGRVLVTGGGNSASGAAYLASAELFDPSRDGWAPAAPMALPRFGHVATLLRDGQVLVSGGRGVSLNEPAERYDPGRDGWEAAGSLRAARWLHAAPELADGRVMAVGGRGDDGPLVSVELYDRQGDAWAAQLPPPSLPLALAEENGSGVSGVATLTDTGNGKITIEMRLSGPPGRRPAHIHSGACGKLGPLRHTLQTVTDGASTTEVEGSLQDLLAGQFAIHLHKSAEEITSYVACANLRLAAP